MNRLIRGAWLVLLFLLVSCDLKVDVPVLPNVGAGSNDNGQSLTSRSRSNTENGTKRWVHNLPISSEVEDEVDMNPDQNCVQVVQLDGEDGPYAVDFGATGCPSQGGTLPMEAIIFTASFSNLGNKRFELRLDEASIGSFDFGSTPELEAYCSGAYVTHCLPFTSGGVITNKPFLY